MNSFERAAEAFRLNVTSSNSTDRSEFDFSLHYRVLATVIHLTIFLLGVIGNAILIAVVFRTRCLQTPTYRYLVSLAFADLMVLLSAVPEALVFHHIGRRWMAGQASCSLFIFINFLGINAGSISILGFSVEIYVAICKPLLSQRFCTINRSNKIIVGLWIFAVFYCAPWLYLTEVKLDGSDRLQCDFRLSKDQYFYYFTADLCLFYVTPLVVALIIYSKIVTVLRHSVLVYKRESCRDQHLPSVGGDPVEMFKLVTTQKERVAAECVANVPEQTVESSPQKPIARGSRDVVGKMRSRTHVLRMLIVIVILFAVLWLPYRGLLVYNTFLEKPWLNLWYLFFAKTLIYLNSAMNPFLYSAMSRRFRQALYATLACQEPYDVDRTETQDGVSAFSLNRINQNLAVITNADLSHDESPTSDKSRHIKQIQNGTMDSTNL